MPVQIHPQNVPGPFHVTDDCIGCGQCISDLPEVFAGDDALNAYVHRQPSNSELFADARHAIERCPVEAIVEETADLASGGIARSSLNAPATFGHASGMR